MKKIIYITICFFFATSAMAQNESQNKGFTFNSFSISPTEYSFSDTENENLGFFSFSADLSFASNRNILTFSASYGVEWVLFGESGSFFLLNTFYGREFELASWFSIDAHAGVGILLYNSEYNLTKTTLPIMSKFRIKIGDTFSVGFKLGANFNDSLNLYSAGIFMQWNY